MGLVVVVVNLFNVSVGLAVGLVEIEFGVVPVTGVTVVVVAGGEKSSDKRREVGEASNAVEAGGASKAEGRSKLVVAARRKAGNDRVNTGAGERGVRENLFILKGFRSRH